MSDFLKPALDERELASLSSLALAHIGDCVYELLVRSYIICRRSLTNRDMHRATVGYVSAAAQAEAMKRILPLLSEEERAVYRRGRNAHVNSIPKPAGVGSYHAATGLECLFGWLYLQDRRGRINELFGLIVEEEPRGTVPGHAGHNA